MSLHPFRHPRLWQGSFALALISVVVLSLLPNDTLHTVDLIGNDKLGHLLAYFVLMAMAIQLHDTWNDWLSAAIGLLSLSILLEGLQYASGLRRADVRDVVANAAGIVLAGSITLTPARRWLFEIEQRFSNRYRMLRPIAESAPDAARPRSQDP